jgi:RNA polymerase sigma-70 factor (ECF subfamily)
MGNINGGNKQKNDNRCEKRWLTNTYNEYHQPIYRFIYRRIGEVETARELTADVFQRLIQIVCRGKEFPQNPRAWLYQTAHNIVIDEYRRRQHRHHLPLNDAIINSDDNPAEEAATNWVANRVRVALKLLTPDQQQIIALKFFEGLTNQEIAEITGKSIGAVKALQHRGLVNLQQLLNPDSATTAATSAPDTPMSILIVESL